MSRMFKIPGSNLPMKTWNVWVGCDFGCTYCSARKLALTRLRRTERYKAGFNPHYVEKEMRRRFRPGDFVFVGYMGDIAFAPRNLIRTILMAIREQPEVRFLFCTKSPRNYSSWVFEYPDNLYLGATIETNFDHGQSKAPPPVDRYEAMKDLDHPHKFISLEPLMDFDLLELVGWIKEIRPEIIEIGPDNYHNSLSEAQPQKVRKLLEMLRDICPTVVEKPGLSRLK